MRAYSNKVDGEMAAFDLLEEHPLQSGRRLDLILTMTVGM